MSCLTEYEMLEGVIFEGERKLKSLREKIDLDKRRLSQLRKQCRHDWSESVYEPEREEAYIIPGDKPGTMGSDFRGPTQVTAKTIDKWTRKCSRCGWVQETTRSAARDGKEPVW